MPTVPATRSAPRRSAFRRPSDLVGRTRWLFGVCALVSLALTSSAAAAGAAGWQLAVLAGSTAALVGSWLHRFLARRSSVALDLLDAAAIGLLALSSPVPALALGVTFSALWFRAVYGRAWEIWVYTAAQCAAQVGASVGAACVVPGTPWTETLRQADLAMYAAKAAGKNRLRVAGAIPVDDELAVHG